jgi:hypothetical protein
MRTSALLALVASATLFVSLAHAMDPATDPYGLWKPLQGAIYKVHSGIVSDRTQPTATDRKLTVLIDGKAAQEVFDSIGPDLPETCSGEKGDRMRDKKGVHCSYSAKLDDPKDTHYRCWIGVNLRTGDSVGTISC